jgi:hypothetical protein
MSTTPERYQPTQRLIDDPERLRELYCEKELSVRAIAEKHSSFGTTRVYEALKEHGICHGESNSRRGTDPPQAPQRTQSAPSTVSWTDIA